MKWLNQVQRFDEVSFIWLSGQLRRSPKAQLARWVSRSGDGYAYPLLCLFAIAIGHPEGKSLLFMLLFGFALELPVYWGLKNVLRRPRPCQRLKLVSVIRASDQFSFPSGHTTAAFLFAGIASFALPQATVYLYAWALAIGLSRVALGVHYPTDIIAGAVLGSCLAISTLTLLGAWV